MSTASDIRNRYNAVDSYIEKGPSLLYGGRRADNSGNAGTSVKIIARRALRTDSGQLDRTRQHSPVTWYSHTWPETETRRWPAMRWVLLVLVCSRRRAMWDEIEVVWQTDRQTDRHTVNDRLPQDVYILYNCQTLGWNYHEADHTQRYTVN